MQALVLQQNYNDVPHDYNDVPHNYNDVQQINDDQPLFEQQPQYHGDLSAPSVTSLAPSKLPTLKQPVPTSRWSSSYPIGKTIHKFWSKYEGVLLLVAVCIL